MNIFGSNYEEVGNLSSNLVLLTAGKVKIRFGLKFVDLIDEKGNINAKIPKIFNEVKSEDEMKSDGFYILNDLLYVYFNGEKNQITNNSPSEKGEYIKYSEKLSLTNELIKITLNNIGITFDSIKDATKIIDQGIVFIGNTIYYIENKKATELLKINEPLVSLNNSNIGNPTGKNKGIVWNNNKWNYQLIATINDIIELQTTIKEIEDKQKKEKQESVNYDNYDLILYSKYFKILEGTFKTNNENNKTVLSNLTTTPDFDLSAGDIVVTSVVVTEVDDIESLPDNIIIPKFNQGNPIKNTLIFNFKTKSNKELFLIDVNGNDKVLEIKKGKQYSSVEAYNNRELGLDIYYFSDENKRWIIDLEQFIEKNIYVKAEQTKKEKFKIDYDNAEIALEENYPSGNNGKPKIIPHTVFGDMEDSKGYYNDPPISFRTIHDRDNSQGLYSDQAVFTGVEFRGKWPDESANLEVKDYPRYSTTLNNLLCSLEEIPEEYNQVIPSIQFIKNQLGGDYVIGAEYISEDKKIYLYKSGLQIAAEIDTTDFIKDGMVSKVEVNSKIIEGEEIECLIITFNEDSGLEEIDIPLSKIFDSKLYYTKTEINELLEGISGEIPDALVLSDWNESDDTKISFIKNKPDIYNKTEIDQKIEEIVGGIPTLQQADWNELDRNSKAYIKNKPDVYTKEETYNKTEINNKLKDLMPLGSIIMWVYDNIPNGWHICDGTILSGNDYKDFIDTLGPTLPDLRCRFVVGINNKKGLTSTMSEEQLFGYRSIGGERSHTLTVNEMPSHTHGYEFESSFADDGNVGNRIASTNDSEDAGKLKLDNNGNKTGSSQNPASSLTISFNGGDAPHNNLPPYYALFYIIKVKNN